MGCFSLERKVQIGFFVAFPGCVFPGTETNRDKLGGSLFRFWRGEGFELVKARRPETAAGFA
jgi:hypothetical protein